MTTHSGLTTKQEWTLRRIHRCTCGSWLVVKQRDAKLIEDGVFQKCPHVTESAMEVAA